MQPAAVSDDIVFLDEEDGPSEAPRAETWKILVVDDDDEIHRVTRLVLAGLSFRDRGLELVPAYSSMEARTILAALPDIAVILLDVVMETDDAGLRLVGFVREQLGNHKVRIILRTGQPGHAPELKVILDYDINDYRAKAELTADRLVTAVVAALRGYGDIEAAEQARWRSRLAEDASIAKSTFLANMSHEIRTPLHAVIGNLELLSLSPLAPEQQRLAGDATVAAQALLDIIGDLLDLSKIEAGGLEIDCAPTDIRGVLREVEAIAAPRARAKALAFIVDVGDAVPRLILSDAVRLRQVLVNLVGNALKFTAEGGVFVTVRREAQRAAVAQLRFDVVDTGIGFDPARAADLFEPFVQEDGSTARRFGGTGLGLTISRRIVEQLGGSIGCDAEPGLGAHFWCVVPALVDAGIDADDRTATSGALASCRVALVGGDGADRATVAGFLRRQGASVEADAGMSVAPAAAILLPQRGIDAVAPPWPDGVPTRVALTVDSEPRQRYALHRRGATHVLAYPGQLEALRSILAASLAGAAILPSAQPAPAARVAATGGLVPRILIIDDTATNRELAMLQLRQLGLAADAAADGAAGLALATTQRYGVILADGSMPMMDGPEFARRLREHEARQGLPRTPIIAVTAHALAGDAERFRAAGMDDHLAKPVTLQRLHAALDRWLSTGGAPHDGETEPPAIDLIALEPLVGVGDRAALADLLDIFRADFPTLLAPIASAVAADDRRALAAAAHAGHGAAGSAAAPRLATLLGRLEQRALTGDRAALAAILGAITAEFERVEAAIVGLRA
jgi:signal transduction histidine kinase/HPt (histidine-containing phosphotransfer) domain-containing protein